MHTGYTPFAGTNLPGCEPEPRMGRSVRVRESVHRTVCTFDLVTKVKYIMKISWHVFLYFIYPTQLAGHLVLLTHSSVWVTYFTVLMTMTSVQPPPTPVLPGSVTAAGATPDSTVTTASVSSVHQ